MADRLYRAQVTIPMDSGIPEDAVVNTFYFDDDDDPIAGPEDTQGWIFELLTAFYQAIDGYIFPGTVAPQATVRLYDMRDAEPRVVRATDTINLNPLGGAALPAEVALCLSFAAEMESGVSPQRRRGRVYIGPCSVDAAKQLNGYSRPNDDARFQLAVAGNNMQDGLYHPASPGLHLKWSVFSPTSLAQGASLDNSFNDVVSGWVDDSWDTQRRRGTDPTTRSTF